MNADQTLTLFLGIVLIVFVIVEQFSREWKAVL